MDAGFVHVQLENRPVMPQQLPGRVPRNDSVQADIDEMPIRKVGILREAIDYVRIVRSAQKTVALWNLTPSLGIFEESGSPQGILKDTVGFPLPVCAREGIGGSTIPNLFTDHCYPGEIFGAQRFIELAGAEKHRKVLF
jgi:hypothetical protein